MIQKNFLINLEEQTYTYIWHPITYTFNEEGEEIQHIAPDLFIYLYIFKKSSLYNNFFTNVCLNIIHTDSFLNWKKLWTPIFRYISLYPAIIYLKRKRYIKKMYKRRKWRRIFSFKKLNKFTKFRKLLKRPLCFTSSIFFNFKISNPLNHLPVLTSKITITQRVIEANYVDFYYKYNKDPCEELDKVDFYLCNNIDFENEEEMSIYLRNYDQKPYWKLRTARILHWKFFFRKTIKQQRYKNFLNFFLKKYDKCNEMFINFFSIFSPFQCSLYRLNSIKKYYKNIIIDNYDEKIFFTPLFFKNYFNWKLLKKKNFKRRKQVGKWSYLNFKKFLHPWLTKKKNFPKKIKHLRTNFNFFKKISHFDPITGYLCFFNLLPKHTIPFTNYIYVNLLIKLHTYRYHAD